MSVKDLTDAHLKKQDYDNKAKEIESQSAKNAAEADKNTEEANGLRRKGLAETLSLVKDQQGFDAAIADYKAHKPLKGEDLSAVYGTTYSPAVNAMAQQTLGKIKSPEQVAQEKDLKSAPGPEAQLLPPEVEAQKARLAQAGKTQPETPDLNSAVSTTRSGLKYVDRSQFTGKEQNALVDAANKAGIPAVSKETADLLSEIDNARSNLDYMNQAIGSKLAKDPTGRLFKGPANTIEKLAQSDPDLAAVGTYRSAAIQAMRAVAGAKGLRINRAEIEQAQENDIPKITDTLPVAQAKLKNMNAFLDNAEKAHLVRDRSAGAPSSPGGTLKNLSTDELLKRLK